MNPLSMVVAAAAGGKLCGAGFAVGKTCMHTRAAAWQVGVVVMQPRQRPSVAGCGRRMVLIAMSSVRLANRWRRGRART